MQIFAAGKGLQIIAQLRDPGQSCYEELQITLRAEVIFQGKSTYTKLYLVTTFIRLLN